MTNPIVVLAAADAATSVVSEVAEHLDATKATVGEVGSRFVADLTKPGNRVAITLGGRVLVVDTKELTLTIENSEAVFFARDGIASRITTHPLRTQTITTFAPGLVLILGKTGAGKSVMLNELAYKRSNVALCQIDEEDDIGSIDTIQVQSPFAIVAAILGLVKLGKTTILIDSLRTLAFAKGVQGKGGFNQELFSTLSGLNRLGRALGVEIFVTLNPRAQDEASLQAVVDSALSSVDTLLIERKDGTITAQLWLRSNRLDGPNFVITVDDLRNEVQPTYTSPLPQEDVEGDELDLLEFATRKFQSRTRVGF